MASHRILIVGTGSIGERHLRCFRATKRAQLSICETNEQQRRTIIERYPGTEGFGDYETALKSLRPGDTVLVATPAQLHVPMARQAVELGLHAFIEKPLSISEEGIGELIEAVRRKGVISAVAFTYRSHPSVRDMQQAIASGRFGRALQVSAAWGQHFPKYRPAYRSTYYTSHATGGGLIQDLLPHAINAAEYFVGPITRVMADADHLALEGVEVEDTTHVIARHGSVMGCYVMNQHQTPNENSITVVCERGTARFVLQESRWYSMVEAGGEWKVEHAFSLERDDIFINQANLWLDALEGKGEVACTLADGWQTLRACLTTLAAAREPGWRDVPAGRR